jgi:hypothetical protein
VGPRPPSLITPRPAFQKSSSTWSPCPARRHDRSRHILTRRGLKSAAPPFGIVPVDKLPLTTTLLVALSEPRQPSPLRRSRAASPGRCRKHRAQPSLSVPTFARHHRNRQPPPRAVGAFWPQAETAVPQRWPRRVAVVQPSRSCQSKRLLRPAQPRLRHCPPRVQVDKAERPSSQLRVRLPELESLPSFAIYGEMPHRPLFFVGATPPAYSTPISLRRTGTPTNVAVDRRRCVAPG